MLLHHLRQSWNWKLGQISNLVSQSHSLITSKLIYEIILAILANFTQFRQSSYVAVYWLKHKNWGWKSTMQNARCASWLQLIIFSRLDILHDMIQIKQYFCQFGELRFLSNSNSWPDVSLHQNDSSEFHLVMYTALFVSCVLPSLFVWLFFF